jgi:3-methylfumaryl-CoA hydratase
MGTSHDHIDLDRAHAYRVVNVDPTLLLRFSALTYNAHRIHYDRDYARNVEGYPGLVVHGPLQALVMAEVAAELLAPSSMDLVMTYKLIAPLLEGQGMHVYAYPGDDAVTAEVRDSCGRTTAHAALSHALVPAQKPTGDRL